MAAFLSGLVEELLYLGGCELAVLLFVVYQVGELVYEACET